MAVNAEQLEKARQAIMRFRELLDLMRVEWEKADEAYEKLFANLSVEDRQTLKEKDQQRLAAYGIIEDGELLSRVALHLRLHGREMEREFEHLYDMVQAIPEQEE